MDKYQERLVDPATGEEIRRKILDCQTQNTSAYDPDGIESLETLVLWNVPWVHRLHISRHGTSHISTADHSGMAISLTTTINVLFGSKVVVPETGVVMNNEMDGISPNSSSAHH